MHIVHEPFVHLIAFMHVQIVSEAPGLHSSRRANRTVDSSPTAAPWVKPQPWKRPGSDQHDMRLFKDHTLSCLLTLAYQNLSPFRSQCNFLGVQRSNHLKKVHRFENRWKTTQDRNVWSPRGPRRKVNHIPLICVCCKCHSFTITLRHLVMVVKNMQIFHAFLANIAWKINGNYHEQVCWSTKKLAGFPCWTIRPVNGFFCANSRWSLNGKWNKRRLDGTHGAHGMSVFFWGGKAFSQF